MHSRFSPQLTSQVHPGAWWLWAMACAFVASNISSPAPLLALCISTAAVGHFRISRADQKANFRILVRVAVWFVGFRILLQTFLGYPMGSHIAVKLPIVDLPTWLSGLRIGGIITWESLLNAFAEGLRMGAIVLAFAAAANLTSPSRVLRNLPAALHELGMIVVIAITFIPHLFADAQRLLQAARWRGHNSGRIRLLTMNIVTLCEAAFDRSNSLAGSLTTRGYGIHTAQSKQRNLVFIGLALFTCSGAYFLVSSRGLVSSALAVCGVALISLGMKRAQTHSVRTKYRPDVWDSNANYFLAISIAIVSTVLFFRNDLTSFAFDSTLKNILPTNPVIAVFVCAVLSPLLLTIQSPQNELVSS